MPLRTQSLLSISRFSKLAKLPRKTLIYYHTIDLLIPEYTDEKGYRFYSYQQLDIAYAIHALKKTGISLEEIKEYLDKRSPQAMIELFERQKEIINKEIRQLRSIEEMMNQRIEKTEKSLRIVPETIVVKKCPREWLYSSPPIRKNGETSWWESAVDFHNHLSENQLELGSENGTMIHKELLEKGIFQQATCIYYKIDGRKFRKERVEKPAGLYAVGYAKGMAWIDGKIYRKLFQYIRENNYTIIGNGYEDYLLDELSVSKPEDYLTRISILIEQKCVRGTNKPKNKVSSS